MGGRSFNITSGAFMDTLHYSTVEYSTVQQCVHHDRAECLVSIYAWVGATRLNLPNLLLVSILPTMVDVHLNQFLDMNTSYLWTPNLLTDVVNSTHCLTE